MNDTSRSSAGDCPTSAPREPHVLEFELDTKQLHAGSRAERDGPRARAATLVQTLWACLDAASSEALLEEVVFFQPLVIDGARAAVVLLRLEAPHRIELRSRPPGASQWTLHAVARAAGANERPRPFVLMASRPVAPGSHVYKDLTGLGILGEEPGYGVERVDIGLERGPGGLSATLHANAAHADMATHTAALEVAIELAAYLAGRSAAGCRLASIDRVWLSVQPHERPASICVVPDGAEAWSLSIADAAGNALALLRGLRFDAAAHTRDRLLAAYLNEVMAVASAVLPLGAAPEPDANLLSLGSTSLDVVRLASALTSALGSAPPLDRILATPTLRSIAGLYADGLDAGREPEDAPCERSPALADLPQDVASYAEQRLWYLERHGDVGAAYNEAAAWQIDGPFDLEVFERCLGELTRRHEALRTAFVERRGRPARKRLERVVPRIELIDVRLERPSTSAVMPRLLRRIAQPFELAKAPLLRTTVWKLGEERHVLLLVAHHVICDGWSLRGVLGKELVQLYREALRGPATGGLPPAMPMSKYALWEQALPPEQAAALVEWWTRELEGFPAYLDMPLDRPRPSQQRHRGAHERVDVPANLAHEIRALARRMGVTPFVVLLAAYQVLVYRYSGQERFLLGVPCSLRQGPAHESLVGCLVNTVPVAAALSPSQSLAEVVEAAHLRVARALAHRAAPLERVIARLGCPRDASHTALTQLAFSFDEGAAGGLEFDGCAVARIELQPPTAKFDLMLQLSDEGGPLFARFEYNSDIFDARRIQAMSRHYIAVLDQLVADARAKVGGAWLLAPSELHDLERYGHGPRAPVPDLDTRAVIDARSIEMGDAPAVSAAGEVTSYAELAADVDRIASSLRERLGPHERLVAICAPRSGEWVAAILAVLRLGRAYLPIDPQVPRMRALALLEQAGVQTLLHARANCAWASEFPGHAIDLGSGVSNAGPETRIPVKGTSPFWAITTSGSTGAPKTATVNYAGVANLLGWYARLLHITPDDRVLVITSIAFDLTQKNLFVALMNGARLVLDGSSIFDPVEVRALVERERVTVINCTPSMLYALVERCGERGFRELRSLRAVVVGGEPVDLTRLQPWLNSASCGARLINSYGPTECTDVCAAFELPAGATSDAPIGRAIDNVQLHVLDRGGNKVPLGVPGELYIAGAALGNGYLLQHGAAENRFVRLVDGQCAYATGDIVQYGWDGLLTFIGRADAQTKIRGHRVSPTEVEAALRAHPRVRDAAVVTADDGTGTALHAYFVTAAATTAAEVRSWMMERVPRYMMPATFVPIASLPLTQSGKVDRNALAVPARAAPAPAGSGLEAQVLALLRAVLRSGAVELDSDFFQSGGHSLLAIRVVDEIEASFSVRLRVLDVFERPTARLIAERIASAQALEATG